MLNITMMFPSIAEILSLTFLIIFFPFILNITVFILFLSSLSTKHLSNDYQPDSLLVQVGVNAE